MFWGALPVTVTSHLEVAWCDVLLHSWEKQLWCCQLELFKTYCNLIGLSNNPLLSMFTNTQSDFFPPMMRGAVLFWEENTLSVTADTALPAGLCWHWRDTGKQQATSVYSARSSGSYHNKTKIRESACIFRIEFDSQCHPDFICVMINQPHALVVTAVRAGHGSTEFIWSLCLSVVQQMWKLS